MPNKYALREVTKYHFKLKMKNSLNILKSDIQANTHDLFRMLLIMNGFTFCSSLNTMVTSSEQSVTSGNMWAYLSTLDCSLRFNTKVSKIF